MIARRVTGNATHDAVTEPGTLITNKKLTLQLFRVRRPRPSQHFVGTFQGHPNSCMGCSPGLFIALFTEADTPAELASGRALALHREECSGESVWWQERCGLGDQKDLGMWVPLSLRGRVTLSETLILPTPQCPCLQSGDVSFPFSSCLCQPVTRSSRTWA